MSLSYFILLLLAISSCSGQTKRQTKEELFNVSHGVSVRGIDSTLIKDIRFVNFDSSVGVVFPKEYAKKIFGKIMGREKHEFFTPDTILIKEIDKKVISQYCLALTRFDSAVWVGTIKDLEDRNDKKSLHNAKEQMAEKKEKFRKLCPHWQRDLIYYDKQFVGYKNDSGETIIYIQLLDFREDPYNLKPAFSISWIDGWHGWFETNTHRVHFHVEKNLLTMNEEL